jgi:hypothetical protein
MNGVTCDAVGGGAGVAVHDGGVLGPTSRRRKPQLLRSPERSGPRIFVATSVASRLRLATLNGRGTVAAKAVSYALAAAVAWWRSAAPARR